MRGGSLLSSPLCWKGSQRASLHITLLQLSTTLCAIRCHHKGSHKSVVGGERWAFTHVRLNSQCLHKYQSGSWSVVTTTISYCGYHGGKLLLMRKKHRSALLVRMLAAHTISTPLQVRCSRILCTTSQPLLTERSDVHVCEVPTQQAAVSDASLHCGNRWKQSRSSRAST